MQLFITCLFFCWYFCFKFSSKNYKKETIWLAKCMQEHVIHFIKVIWICKSVVPLLINSCHLIKWFPKNWRAFHLVPQWPGVPFHWSPVQLVHKLTGQQATPYPQKIPSQSTGPQVNWSPILPPSHSTSCNSSASPQFLWPVCAPSRNFTSSLKVSMRY